ncbi:MAG: hypothetical protein AB7S44_03810 [Spirochaetales bacterium]
MRKVQKKKVRIFPIILVLIVLLLGANFTTNYIMSNNNYDVNLVTEASFSNFSATGYISDTTKIVNFKYSYNPTVSNYSSIVATYNALNYLSRQALITLNDIYASKTEISEIIKHLDLWGQVGLGYMGTSFFAVSSYFKKIGLESELIFNKKEFATEIASNDVCILFHTNFSTFEFRAASYDTATTMQLYGPNTSANIANYINIGDYAKDFFVLIAINVPEETV